MTSRITIVALFVAAVLVAIWAKFFLPPDTVSLVNTTAGAEAGIFVSAHQATDFQDRGYPPTLTNSISVGSLTAAAQRNEVIGFTQGRGPGITSMAPWTIWSDTVSLQFPPEIPIDITVWVIDPPFSKRENDVKQHCSIAGPAWLSERMGVSFGTSGCTDIRDVTTVPGLNMYRGHGIGFRCTGISGLQSTLQPVAGRINIYIVNKVITATGGGGPGWGDTCKPDAIGLGVDAIDGTFIHELGHAFSLAHIDPVCDGPPLPQFDFNNFMACDSGTRQYFTEGQIFRSHVTPHVNATQPGSALNVVYKNARLNLPVRDCDIALEPCPALERRLWADGALPPN